MTNLALGTRTSLTSKDARPLSPVISVSTADNSSRSVRLALVSGSSRQTVIMQYPAAGLNLGYFHYGTMFGPDFQTETLPFNFFRRECACAHQDAERDQRRDRRLPMSGRGEAE